MRRLAPLLVNLALAAGVSAGLLAALEGAARWREARRPAAPVTREFIRGWQAWEGEFYHLGRRPPHWPLEGDGVSLSLLLFPYEHQVRPGARPPQLQLRLLALARERGLPAQDLLEPLRRLGPAAFIDHNHLSPAGTRAVAEALLSGPLLPRRTSYPALAAAGASLEAPGGEQRAAAAWLLGQRGPVRQEARALAARLADAEDAVRVEALRALARARADDSLRTAAAAALRDRHEAVRLEAARTLWAWGPVPGDAPALMAGLAHPDGYIRAFAEASLARLGPAVLPAARAALASSDAGVRRRALRLIGRLGRQGQPAAQDVAGRLGDGDPGVRRLAARVLRQIGGEGGSRRE